MRCILRSAATLLLIFGVLPAQAADDKMLFDALKAFVERRKGQGNPVPKIYWVDTDFSYGDSRQELLRLFESPLEEHAIEKDLAGGKRVSALRGRARP